MYPGSLTVWFLCKSCKLNFAKVEDFIEHKKENHFTEFQLQNTSCIVFEEKIDGDIESGSLDETPTFLQGEFQLTNDSRIEMNSHANIVSCFDDPKLTWQIADITGPTIAYYCGDSRPIRDTLVPNTKCQSQEENTITFDSFQSQQNPYVLVKRLTSKEIQDACSPTNKKLNLNKHLTTSFIRRPFKCLIPNCGKVYTTRWALRTHNRNSHSDERPFGCPHCDKKFKFRHKLVEHVRVHTGERPCKCPVGNCNKSFRKLTTLCRHKRKVHRKTSSQNKSVERTPRIDSQMGANDEPSYVSCSSDPKPKLPWQIADDTIVQINDAFYGDSDSLTQQILVPKTELITYESQVQEAQTSSMSSFQREQHQIALPKEPTSGKIQSKGASSSATNRKLNLNKHLKTHFIRRPFKCNELNCGKAFKYKRSLWSHVKCHSDLRPFGCPQCDKAYKRRDHLVEHVRVHTGERPYKCRVDNCGKSYTSSKHLCGHKRRAHRNKY